MQFAKNYVEGRSAVLTYWFVGLPGTCLVVVALNWAYIELSASAYSYRHLFPPELITSFGKNALAIGLLAVLVPPLLAFYYFVYVGTARAAQQTTGWSANFLWMGLGGHASISLSVLLFILIVRLWSHS